MIFETSVEIVFGDCDPAGIVFYPNYFRWLDAAYQGFLKTRGLSQRILTEKLGTIGTGAIDAGATFRAPATYGDQLIIKITGITWRDKTFRVAYEGWVGDRLIIEGCEVRGLFIWQGKRLTAAPIAPFKALLDEVTE